MNNPNATEQNFWDSWNASGGPKYPRDEVVRFCFRRYPERSARAGVRVLDLGCGGGVHTLFLAEEGFQVVACDISSEGVAMTRKRLAERNLSAETLVAPIEALNLPEASLDIILSIGVLECTHPGVAEAAIPKLAKLLRPKGAGFFMFASDQDCRVASPDNPYVRRGFTENEVRSIFGAAFPSVDINRHIATERNQSIALNEWMVSVGAN